MIGVVMIVVIAILEGPTLDYAQHNYNGFRHDKQQLREWCDDTMQQPIAQDVLRDCYERKCKIIVIE